jgi:hypothetical protein
VWERFFCSYNLITGNYTLTGIPKGTYELTVSYIGFNPGKKQVTTEPGKTTVVDFSLKAGIELSEIVVSGQLQGQSKALNTQMNKGNITNIISSDQVGRFPDANIGDASKKNSRYQCAVRPGRSTLWKHKGNSTPIQFGNDKRRTHPFG